jgi:hypothetical protein
MIKILRVKNSWLRLPKIIIVFSLADKPLAEKLSTILQAGKVIGKPNAGHVI